MNVGTIFRRYSEKYDSVPSLFFILARQFEILYDPISEGIQGHIVSWTKEAEDREFQRGRFKKEKNIRKSVDFI